MFCVQGEDGPIGVLKGPLPQTPRSSRRTAATMAVNRTVQQRQRAHVLACKRMRHARAVSPLGPMRIVCERATGASNKPPFYAPATFASGTLCLLALLLLFLNRRLLAKLRGHECSERRRISSSPINNWACPKLDLQGRLCRASSSERRRWLKNSKAADIFTL